MAARFNRFFETRPVPSRLSDSGLDASDLWFSGGHLARFGLHPATSTGPGATMVSPQIAAAPHILLSPTFENGAFTAGNLVVYRVGDGAAALTANATAVFLDEYSIAGGPSVNTVTLPTSDAGGNQTLTASGTATSEGLLTLSTDGHYLMLAGYDTTTGTTNIVASTAATINRVVGRVASDGTINVTTALNDFASTSNPRAAVSTNGTDLWVTGGNGGVRYATLGATTSTQLNATLTNIRAAQIFDGQLYISSGSGAFRIATVGTGLPTTGTQTITNLTFNAGNAHALGSPYGFFFANLDGVAGLDTLYVCDDGIGLLKFSLVSGSWVENGLVGVNADDYRGLTATISGVTVTLYATRDNGSSADTIVGLVDSAGYNANFSSATVTTIATAAANTAFRGIAFAPTPAVASETQTVVFNPVSVTHAEGNSGTTAYVFTVTRTGGSAGQLDFSGTIAAGSTDSADFVGGLAPTVFSGSILAGQTSATITVNVQGDLTIEGDESFTLTITNATNGAAGVTTVIGANHDATGNITNDDAAGAISVADVTLAEGDTGTTPGTFTLTRTGGTSGAVSVSYTITLPGGVGGADGTDVSATLTGTVNFAEGQTSATIPFTINGDRIVEPDETFTVVISSPTGGATLGTATATATITNDDVAGSVSVADISITEGNSGQSLVTITLTRTGGSGDFTVDYTTADDSATAGSDYDATSGTASFTGGATSVTFTVPINGDTVSEADETFFVNLSNATAGATISDAQGVVTITNDEGAGSVAISDAQVVEGDSGTMLLVFTLTRTGGADAFGVTVSTGDDSALAGTDYVAQSTMVSFAANQTTATFSVVVNGDTDIETDETLTATLSGATNGASIGDGSGTGTITNDDFPPAGSVSIADMSIVEGNSGTSLLVFTLTRTGGTRGFSVDFATANGGDPTHASASAGSDYVAQSGSVVFADGQDTATVSIVINGDVTPELSEEFSVALSNATNGATISDASAIGTIANDDTLPGNMRIFTEDFAAFTAGGFAPTPTADQVDSDIWRVVGLSDITNPAYGFTGAAGTDFGRGIITGTADPTIAGVYSPSANHAMVLQPTGAELDVNGFIEARIVNNSGSLATGFGIAFDWVYRNSGDRADNMQLSYSTDGINFINVPAAAFSTPSTKDASIAGVFTYQHEVVNLTGLSVADQGFLYIRWVHATSSGSGNRDEVGIDNLTVDASVGTAHPTITVSDVSVNEAAGTMTFTVSRFNLASGAFTVDYATADGTAIAGQDYTATNGTLSFADNQTQATVTVSITNDAFAEFDETLFLNLSNPTGTATIADNQAQGTITNDDGTPITVSINDVSLAEGDSGTTIMTFTVTRSGGTGAFDVNFQTADESATAGQDYVGTSGMLSFGVGENSKTISVTINGDTDPEATETFRVLLSSPTNGAIITDGTGVGTIQNDEPTFIHDIQGTSYFSPILAGEGISTFNTASIALVTIRAVVTAVDADGPRQGFYITEELTDWDGNNFTSEGIFVMTRNDAGVGNAVSGVAVGDLVTVTGHVMEYQGFATNMPVTTMTSPTSIIVESHGNSLPTFLLDASHHIPSDVMTGVAPDYTDSSDGAGDSFDAANYALSFFETVENMLVTVPDMVVADGFVSTSGGQPFFQAYSLVHADADQINSRGGYTIAGDPPLAPPNTPEPGDDTIRDGRHVSDGDINPDIIELDFTGWAMNAPAGLTQNATMGDHLGDVTGIIDFQFTDRKLFVTSIDPGNFVNHVPTLETTALGDDDRALTVATFNVENLDPSDGAARFTALANAIANNLNAPDILSIEEMQDNNGATDDGTTDASTTWQMLVNAVNLATGGHYQWVDQEPTNDAEGGEPGGNIRVGFLYNTDRVQLGDLAANATLDERRHYTDRVGDGVRDSGDLIQFSDNMISGEINAADWTTTRKSLLGQFTFHGNTVFVTANHFPSKGGSGSFWQFNQNIDTGNPTNSDWTQRSQVAQDVYTMLNLIQSSAPDAGIVSGGDYNDFYFYRPLTTMTGYTMADGTARVGGARFDNLTLTLSEAERYTYAFDGRSQAIDHIIANSLMSGIATYDVVHINTGYNTRGTGPDASPALSDHDPGLSSYDFRNLAETLTGTGGADTIQGFGGNDIINAGGGDDLLDGGAGTDTLSGAGGNDIYVVDGSDVIVEAVGQGFDQAYSTTDYTLAAGVEVEVLSVNDYAATTAINLTGNEFGQAIFGNAGDNFLIAGGGADALYGGAGNDTYSVDTLDVVFDSSGFDTVYASGNYALNAGAQIEILSVNDYAATVAINLAGNEFGQSIYGNAGDNFLVAGGGADGLYGGLGNDTYSVDTLDVVVDTGGFDIIYSSTNFTLNAGAQIEILSANDYAATTALNLAGNELDQSIFGNAGDNFLIAGAGADGLYGKAGNDTYSIDSQDVVVENAGEGYDIVYTSTSFTLNAGAEVELISVSDYAATSAINLVGNEFGQQLLGNAGANILNGLGGNDGLVGGGGADVFAFTSALGAGNVDAIGDFSAVDDTIWLDDAVFTALTPGGLAAGAFVVGAAAGDADDRIIYNQATGQLFYDADGSGGGAAMLFATLQGNPVITAADFAVI